MRLNALPGIGAKRTGFGTLVLVSVLFVCARIAFGGNETRNHALILGGGGPVGEAWEAGVIAGLAERGIDLSSADLIVGTSAGAIVGARLALKMPASDFINAALIRPDAPPGLAPDQSPPDPPDLSFLVGKFRETGAGEQLREPIRAEIGKWAQKARPVVSESQFVASFKRRFPEKGWPDRDYVCTAIETSDGSLRVWNRSSGVPLALAVASSCAFPGLFAPVAINAHEYMDGGIRSPTNADLAVGCKTALVLAPTIGQTDPIGRYNLLDRELKTLRNSGCKIALIIPDAASLKAFGPTLGDEGRRAPAANAGLIEGRAKAGEIATAWGGAGRNQ
jgi:NTE family protein